MEKTEERKTAEGIVGKIFTKDRRKFKTQKEFLKYLKNLLLSSIEIQQTAIRRLEETNEGQKILIEVTNLIVRLFSETKIKEFLRNAEKGEIITKEEHDKLMETIKTMRGKKVKKETFELYCKIVETNNERIKNNEDSNYKKSAQIVLKDNSLSDDEKDQIYKNFNTWFNSPKNQEIISRLLSK